MSLDREDFLMLDNKSQLAFLKHPSWSKRCLCKKFGLPWNIKAVLADNDIRHTHYICAPIIEFLEDEDE